ncbi:peptidoglycan/LPS O-acetylase OafA/YrhL [Mucilaginibacter sp. UYP25]|uniref:acyltransferase family protein n=1 Tax=unclassified Mucilaginibacter TaxID=2617802 RepID=UPI0033909E6D
MKHIKELDGVRGIAVTLVIIEHWFPKSSFLNKLPNGAIGVSIFFVLSGFLISRILFETRVEIQEAQQSAWQVIKNFYLRRALRIFPIYYLCLAILYIFEAGTSQEVRGPILYFITFTQNFYFFHIDFWPGILSHLWSLAVEEQFYLCWPFLMLFVNKRYLLAVIVLVISFSVCTQFLMRNINMSGLLTFNCLHAFGTGTLLSWFIHYKSDMADRALNFLQIIGPLSAVLILLGNYFSVRLFAFQDPLICVVGAWLIFYIYKKHDTEEMRFRFLLANPIAIYIGRVSYGIYLYHNLVPKLLNYNLVNIYINPYLPNILKTNLFGWLFLTENLLMLLAVASLSYYLIERPILKLKNRFSYRRPQSNQKRNFLPLSKGLKL